MSTFLIVSFVACAYLVPPFFILHLLWILISAWRTGKPLAVCIQDIVVVHDDVEIPHPPGFYHHSDAPTSKNRSQSTLEGTSYSSAVDSEDALSVFFDISVVHPDTVVLHDCQPGIVTGDVLSAEVFEPTRPAICTGVVEGRDADLPKGEPPSPFSHSSSKNIILRMRKVPKSWRNRRNSGSPSSTTDSMLNRISFVLKKRKDERTQCQDKSGTPLTKFGAKLARVKNKVLLRRDCRGQG